ncbi:MAG: hypothetical protein HY864_19025 [Chloroflexi bacterium]|nr:hypothetical protein [Chloroflexota bacterium]
MKTRHRPQRIPFYFLLFILLTSCAAPPAAAPVFPQFILVTQDPNASPTPTPFQPAGLTATEAPTFTPIPPTQTATQTPLPASPTTAPATSAVSTAEADSASRTNYILYATLDFTARTLSVDETIRYYNNTGSELSDIVLSVQPNLYGSTFTLNSVTQDGAALTNYSLSGQRLGLTLPQPLQPGTPTTLTLSFNLNIPAKSSNGIFGYDFNQINLVEWYPFIVPHEASGGWILHDPISFGEHLVYDSSDIEVNLKTDSDVVIAASAPSEPNGEWTRYRLFGARTFALSASDEFIVTDTAVGDVVIRSYYFDGYQAAGDAMLFAALQAVSIFSAKFAPYPYQTLAVVQTDIHDGQEYDGLVFLATDFYGQYSGGARNNLTTIGVHEIAHQWWFGLVGNDQAFEPWLDEAMSVYSEHIFYEFNYPGLVSWWWQYRVDYFKPGGYVDTSIYNGGTFRTYTNAAYLNGSHFIDDLRGRMGDDAFFAFLKDYASRYSRGRATSYDFFAAVRANTSADISDLLAAYFSGAY